MIRSPSACASRRISCASRSACSRTSPRSCCAADQRVVERLVALAERAQLLVEAPRLGVEILIDARQPLHLLGDLIPELIDARGIVAAQRATEVVAPHVQWRKMKRFVDHLALAPKRVVPSRTMVAPSSTAIS